MAKTVKTLEYRRGTFGTIIKWLFIGFNLLMCIWLISYWTNISSMLNTGSEMEQAGAALGSTIGTGLILMIWGLGTVIIGIPLLLTKGKLVETEETENPTATTQQSPKNYLKLVLQYVGSALFLLLGIGAMMQNFLSGMGLIIAGALLLPKTQSYLVKTPLNRPIVLALVIIGITILSLYISDNKTTTATNAPSNKAPKQVEDETEPGKQTTKPDTPNDSWNVTRGASSMDDTPSISVSKDANNSSQAWLEKVTPTLIIRCRENKTDVIFATGTNFHTEYGEYNNASIRYRIDDKKAQSQYWGESTDGNAAFSPNPVSLLKNMKDAKSLKIEFIPFNSNPSTAEFDLEGLRPHLEEIANTCKWKL